MSFYAIAKAFTYGLTRLLFKMRYEGTENIPQNQGYILAANHRSNYDPLFVAHKVPQELRFMAKAELFRHKPLAFLLRNLGAFPVARGKGDTSAMDTARKVIKDGEVLMVFPEGTRSKDGTPGRGRSGVALLAAQTQAPVLPCAIIFGKKLRLRTAVTVRYGNVLGLEELGCDAEKPSSIRLGAKRVMSEIVTLME